MADILTICNMIERMADGFESQAIQCIGDNAVIAERAVREQLYSGIDGDGNNLSPTYDNDPYFEEEGTWYHRSKAYKEWKREKTPPKSGTMLMLQPRLDNIPNLFINGKFHSEIFANMEGDKLSIGVDPDGNGPDIVKKYGDQILQLSPTAIGYFNEQYLLPHIWRFFENCGYKS